MQSNTFIPTATCVKPIHHVSTLNRAVIILLLEMGGNNSRLRGNGGEVLSARIRHRMEEFRQRKSRTPLRGEDTSNKQLYYDAVDGPNSQSSKEYYQNEDKKASSNYPKPPKRVEKLSKVVPFPISEPGIEEHRNELHNQQKTKDVHNKGNAGYDSGDDEDQYDEAKEDEEIESGRYIGPGSPSFRIYCNEPYNKNVEQFRESKSLGTTLHMLQIIEMKSASKRKGNKKNTVGGAMKKNLLHVKQLHMNRMNQMLACTGSDRRRLDTDH
ncbi:hypothetical protein CR513_11590, partial [Mucuna pruriens]